MYYMDGDVAFMFQFERSRSCMGYRVDQKKMS